MTWGPGVTGPFLLVAGAFLIVSSGLLFLLLNRVRKSPVLQRGASFGNSRAAASISAIVVLALGVGVLVLGLINL